VLGHGDAMKAQGRRHEETAMKVLSSEATRPI
jgi:hypothetical protein